MNPLDADCIKDLSGLMAELLADQPPRCRAIIARHANSALEHLAARLELLEPKPLSTTPDKE